jgi:hypothetical protein
MFPECAVRSLKVTPLGCIEKCFLFLIKIPMFKTNFVKNQYLVFSFPRQTLEKTNTPSYLALWGIGTNKYMLNSLQKI